LILHPSPPKPQDPITKLVKKEEGPAEENQSILVVKPEKVSLFIAPIVRTFVAAQSRTAGAEELRN
jgi:hypothetical protein